jgi:hypothetical protein
MKTVSLMMLIMLMNDDMEEVFKEKLHISLYTHLLMLG